MMKPTIKARLVKHVAALKPPNLIPFLQSTKAYNTIGVNSVFSRVAELIREDPIHVELISKVGEVGAEEDGGVVGFELEEVEKGDEDGAEVRYSDGDCGD